MYYADMKSLKILLIETPASKFAWNRTVSPPLGLLYLSSVLKKGTFNETQNNVVKILPLKLWEYLGKDLSYNAEVEKFHPDVIGISCPTPSYSIAKKIMNDIRSINQDIIIIAGGYQATMDYINLLGEKNADIVVRGEGEATFSECIHAIAIEGFRKLKSIDGISYRNQNGKVFANKSRKRIDPLDQLPFPDRNSIPMKKYIKINKYRAGGIIGSRGCNFNCNYCYSPAFWKGGRKFRSAKNIADEIEHIQNKYKLDFFRFEDDLFFLNRKEIVDLCKEILERGISIKWICKSRPDLISNDRDIKMMKKAGLTKILMGIETTDNTAIQMTKRKISKRAYQNAINICRKNNVGIIFTFIVGLPFEKPNNMINTIKWIKNNLDENDSVIRCLFTPFEGTDVLNEDITVHNDDFSKYTMDYPLTSCKKYSLDKLKKVKKIADELMLQHRSEEQKPF